MMAIKKGYWNSDALANPAMRSRDDSYSNIKLSAGESWDIDSAMTNLEMNQQGNVDIHTLGVSVPTVDKIIIKSNIMPTASADLLGAVYQYVGQTDGTYEHGYIYECKEGGMFTPDIISCSMDDLKAYIQSETPYYSSVVKGTMTKKTAGLNPLWEMVAKDINNNIVSTYNGTLFMILKTQDEWESVGFTFSDNIAVDTVVNFTFNDPYIWERIDVQPGGSRGRFLALWDCTTGLAETNPPISPYEYKTGDYFVVGVVGTTNYRPDGTAYVVGVPSATVETAEVAVDDTYFFDGTQWKLQSNSNKTVSFSGIAGSPYDNTNLASALNAKQDVIADLETIRTGAATYTHDQAVAASVWTINHNLGKYPSITVVDTGGNVVTGKYSYPDTNTIVAEFNAAFKGTAYLN